VLFVIRMEWGFYKDMAWRKTGYHTRRNSNLLANYTDRITGSFQMSIINTKYFLKILILLH